MDDLPDATAHDDGQRDNRDDQRTIDVLSEEVSGGHGRLPCWLLCAMTMTPTRATTVNSTPKAGTQKLQSMSTTSKITNPGLYSLQPKIRTDHHDS
jgi:hypothetical protein